ncbi:MAG: ABC transporter substrate-binding protein [Desulfobacterales bacterium]|nr:ABC transporter substrate-binding protein [Desulfobacterales bacterium]
MKKNIITYVSIAVAIICVSLLLKPIFLQDNLYIAVIGPMKGEDSPNGEEMRRGIQLYLDRAKKEKNFLAGKIKLLFFDDEDNSRRAMEIATKVAEDERVILVLGHLSSSPCIAAGAIYKKEGIPSITGSATSEFVTTKNDWYFSILPTSEVQTGFIAHYLKKREKKSVSIIYTDDSYGYDLYTNFIKYSEKLGIEIVKSWKVSNEKDKLDSDLKWAITELRTIKEPGVIFLATGSFEGAKILSMLNYSGTNYSIICPDSFAGKKFLKEIKKYEGESPGCYSNDICVLSPFIADIAGHEGRLFRKDFVNKYYDEPTWIAAMYYDAMHVAMKAMEKAGVSYITNIRDAREKIRKTLKGFLGPDNSVPGLSGNIYFDENGNTNRTLAFGMYSKQKLYPTFVQYQEMDMNLGYTSSNIISDALQSKIIEIGDRRMKISNVIYTNIIINEIKSLNIDESKYNIDFEVSFLSTEDTSGMPALIKFSNSDSIIKLGKPILDLTKDGYTLKTYHVDGTFNIDFDFRKYPFDKQKLFIKFYHPYLQRNSLIFIHDTGEISKQNNKRDINKIVNAINGWKIENIKFYEDIIKYNLPLKVQNSPDLYYAVNYSQCNAEIEITRKHFGLIFQVYAPILLIIVVLFILYFVPYDKFGARITIIMGAMVITALYHLKLNVLIGLKIKYLIYADYAYLALYIFIIIPALISVYVYVKKRVTSVRE